MAVALSANVTFAEVTAVTTSVTDGFENLDEVVLSTRGPISGADLVNVTVFSFNNGRRNAFNLIQVGGSAGLPDPRQGVMEDLALNNGTINPGAGSPVSAGQVIDDSVVGLGVRFNTPVSNGTGVDALFFELSVGAAEAPDSVTIALLDDSDAVIGSEVTFPSSAYHFNSDQEDSTVVSVGAGSLDQLNNNTGTNGSTVDSYYNLLEIDFSAFGVPAGTNVNGLYVRSANVDPVLIAGIHRVPSNPINLSVEGSGGDLVLTWNSKDGMLYNLLSDADLQPDPDMWGVHGPIYENIEATPPLNTLIIPRPGADEHFFAVREFPVPPE